MKKKSLVYISNNSPFSNIKTYSIWEKPSLLDYDIVIFSISDIILPKQTSFTTINGVRYLSKEYTAKLSTVILFWQNQISEILSFGQNVYFILHPYYIRKVFDHKGHHEQEQNFVSNYSILPTRYPSFENKHGVKIKLAKKDSQVAEYWEKMSSISDYKTVISSDTLIPLLVTIKGDRTVGGIEFVPNSNGRIVYLPHINFNVANSQYRNHEECFLSAIFNLDNQIRNEKQDIDKPDWIESPNYALRTKTHYINEFNEITNEIANLEERKRDTVNKLTDESSYELLLYGSGKPLEQAVRNILRHIGFTAEHYEDHESEFDAICKYMDITAIAEVEGKQNKAVEVKKLRQLITNIGEYFDREEVKAVPKGILIGNAYATTCPNERGDFFTDKCISLAKSNQIALVRSIDLFFIYQYISSFSNDDFCRECVETILHTSGVVVFPVIPEQ